MKRLLTLALALTMAATACGSATDSVEAADTGSAATTDSPTASATTDSQTQSDDESASSSAAAPTSLEDYLGSAALAVRGRGGGGLANLDSDQLAEEQRLMQVEIQRCMQAQGFEYVPEESTDGLRIFARAEDQGLSAEEYAATQGFGISTAFDAIFSGDVDLSEATDPSPNDDLLASLSESEAEAWQLALRGQPPERDDQGRLIDPDTGELLEGGPGRQRGGCELDAELAVRGDISLLGELADAWDALEERIDADARITEIRRDWAACMLDKGFDYQDPAEARADIQSQIRPLMRSFVQAAVGEGEPGEPGQGGPGRGGAGGFISVLADQGLSDEQEAELQALQDLEIAAAVASLECSGDTETEIAEITARYEAEFIETNRATLEAFAQ